jgi:hypothetical protein
VKGTVKYYQHMVKVNKIVVLTEKELSELIFITVSGAGKQCSRQTEWAICIWASLGGIRHKFTSPSPHQ